ncbi:MAG: Fe-Mn family superoxide dismutase [Candidatus Taylorbacteria bacterium]|nr:Fe-Mn family superoxide dismutase [Candidatus Taylorbacteria bacterium]
MPKKEIKPLRFNVETLKGISQKTIEIHHGKLYAGYVNKSNEISEKLGALRKSGKVEGNQIYSELRGLKLGETFAVNGVYLHENYFAILGGDGVPRGEIVRVIEEKWGSMNDFKSYFSACGMAARGWAILAWDMHEKKLMQYNCDAQNHGGIWGAVPIIAMDVYEHSYFIDVGSDRAAYIKAFFDNLNWDKIEEFYQKAKKYEWD